MKIVFRTDASIAIGAGHVMRCLSLADAFHALGADISFVCRMHPGHLVDSVRKRGYLVHELPARPYLQLHEISDEASRNAYARLLGATQEEDAQATIDVLNGEQPDWLIIDHYALDCIWENFLRPYVRKMMVIDDLADRPHECDVLLDQNYAIDGKHRYDRLVSPSCTRLLGPSYALLRRDFSEFRLRLMRRSGDVRRLLVFFGGSDPFNLTARSLEALCDPRFENLEVEVVTGSGNPHNSDIRRLVADMPNARLSVQVDNMAELMSKADFAIGAGGTASVERLCLGLPSIVVTFADNQVRFTHDLQKHGALIWLGSHETVRVHDITSALAKVLEQKGANCQMSEKGMLLVQGDGVSRVVQILMNGISEESWTIRKASVDDCKLFWHWANDDEVRRNAFDQEPIPWDTHQNWFMKRIVSPDCLLLVIDSLTGPIGQVRFDHTGSVSLISYSLGRQFRRMGLGKKMLATAIDYLCSLREPGSCFLLDAEVRPKNQASSRIFEAMGFSEVSESNASRRRFQKMYIVDKGD